MGSRAVKLTVHLLKEGVSVADALADGPVLVAAKATVGGVRMGDLRLYRIPAHPPGWASFFPEQGAELAKLLTAGAGGLLFVKRKRLFAVTFGYASHLLEAGVVEEGFGLKVTLNSVPGDQIRSVDSYTPDTLGRRTKTQASRAGTIPDFGLDIEQDLLRSVTGVPTDSALAKRMEGRDSLSVVVQTDLASLPGLLDKYLDKFKETTYRADFGWVDKVREISDATIIAKLNARLVDQMRTGKFEKTWMAVPDIVEWSRIEGFRYGSGEREPLHADLHVNDLRASFRDPKSIQLASLKKHVKAFDDPKGAPTYHWSAYSCVYCELDLDGETYLLTNGRWFRIATDFVKEVTDEVKRLPASVTLPDYDDDSEEAYCKRVAKSDRSRYALMDRKLISYGGGYSKVEFCDLFTSDDALIHIKRYAGSAVLSHLFQQGVVSGNLLVVSQDFRRDVNALLPASHRLPNVSSAVPRAKYRVVFAVTSNRDKPLHQSLPFFSKLSLRNAARTLHGLGFAVELVKIKDKTST